MLSMCKVSSTVNNGNYSRGGYGSELMAEVWMRYTAFENGGTVVDVKCNIVCKRHRKDHVNNKISV